MAKMRFAFDARNLEGTAEKLAVVEDERFYSKSPDDLVKILKDAAIECFTKEQQSDQKVVDGFLYGMVPYIGFGVVFNLYPSEGVVKRESEEEIEIEGSRGVAQVMFVLFPRPSNSDI
jgi:hypothetical protein